MYCVEHKLDGMVNVSDRRCIYEGCKIQPGFNKEGETKGLYCNVHKLDGMVNVSEKRKCIIEGCTKRNPIYNIEGEIRGLY